MKLVGFILISLLSSCTPDAYGSGSSSLAGPGQTNDPVIEPDTIIQINRSFFPRVLFSSPTSSPWVQDLIAVNSGAGPSEQVPHLKSTAVGQSSVYIEIPHQDGERFTGIEYRALGTGTVSASAKVIMSPNDFSSFGPVIASITDVNRGGPIWATVTPTQHFGPTSTVASSVWYLLVQADGPGYRVGKINAFYQRTISNSPPEEDPQP